MGLDGFLNAEESAVQKKNCDIASGPPSTGRRAVGGSHTVLFSCTESRGSSCHLPTD